MLDLPILLDFTKKNCLNWRSIFHPQPVLYALNLSFGSQLFSILARIGQNRKISSNSKSAQNVLSKISNLKIWLKGKNLNQPKVKATKYWLKHRNYWKEGDRNILHLFKQKIIQILWQLCHIVQMKAIRRVDWITIPVMFLVY